MDLDHRIKKTKPFSYIQKIILTNILQPSEYVRSKADVVIKKMALINSQQVSKKADRTELTI